MASFFERLGRRKIVQLEKSELNRVLSTLDLTALGVGSTIGVGIYVLAGQVARGTSGPAVTISFLIAAVASLFAGLCYAEFGARVPKAGSAYVYAYVCIGEFVAFVIGWNLILEYVIGTASVASGYSRYIDDLTNNTIRKTLTEAMPINSDFMSPFPDFLAFALAAVLSIGLALGVKESSKANNLFTGINIIVISFVIIAAGTQGDLYNWKIPADELGDECQGSTLPDGKEDWGSGGFSPWGFQGIMEGAAICFFGFVGFDVIATTGEETLNPSRTIPISIGISLTIVFLSYFGVAAVITLVVPYCQQDEGAPLVALFDDENIGWVAAKWFVTVGALFGFSASLFGALFPLPRVLYAMASDGLLFRQLSQISKRFQTPTIATVIAGLSAGLMAMLFDLEALVSMMSIGTLMAYSIVALCVMLLRFKDEDGSDSQSLTESGLNQISTHQSSYSASDYLNQLFNQKGLKKPTDLSASIVSYAILLFCVMVLLLDIALVVLVGPLVDGEGGAVAGICILLALNILIVIIIARQPESKKKLSFKVPFVPWLPALSTMINTYLMCNLSPDTWVRFAVWMFIGLVNYFGYSIKNSSIEYRMQGKKPPCYDQSIENVKHIGTVFDSESEEDIYSMVNSD